MQCDRLMLMVGLSFLTLSRWLTTDSRRFMIIPMLCVTIFVILVVWFLLPRVARLMIHTPTAISIFVCLSMVQLMAVFISLRCTLCGHFLQLLLTLILVVGYFFFFQAVDCIRHHCVTGVQTCALPISTKNQEKQRDPEMHQTKKGNQWYFGMKAHIGADRDSKLVHTLVATAANVADITKTAELLHGQETQVHADAGYTGVEKRAEI